jgi:two-component system response regulator HydG
LVVDDDPATREGLGSLFSGEGHTCQLAADGTSALKLIEQQAFDAVVSDVVMEGMSGLELLDRVKRVHPSLPFVVITGAGGVHQAVEAIKRGAFEYLLKPCNVDELMRALDHALEAGHRRGDTGIPAALDAGHLALLGESPAMQALRAAIDFVAGSSAPVLVTGETGVGKELVARAIHARSERHGRPLVAVNTAAIPQELLEGEIFGHARGAFTGAVQARRGLLTEADGGTLLLDEIGDMSFGLQAKLLRVLQFGDVRPVGSDRTHHVDVRVIASSHRNLPALVREGRFREDLLFRLDVLSVHVPPLRDHREDIPTLAVHFLAHARRRAPASPVRAIGPRALHALQERDWPGNVRELASVIERAVVFGAGETIDDVHLPAVSGAEPVSRWPCGREAPWTMQRLSRAYSDWVLAQTGGNRTRAADIMGVNLSTIYRWQRKRP